MHVCISRIVGRTGNDSNRQTTRRSPESSEVIDTRRRRGFRAGVARRTSSSVMSAASRTKDPVIQAK